MNCSNNISAKASALKAAPKTAQLASAVRAGAKISEHRLKNGLRVLIIERHTDPVVAVMTWYRVGSADEREHETGLSHFLEHMMFKGSNNFGKGEVDRITAQLGGVNNAFTGHDHTAYWFELASDRWERALEIEADRMSSLTLDAEEFDAERSVVLEELSMGLDDPWRRLSQSVHSALFERHPYRRPVIGYADVLKAVDVQDMRDYYQRFYRPDNATLVICGDVQPEQALRAARRTLGALKSAPVKAEAPKAQKASADLSADFVLEGDKRVELSWDDQGKRMIMAWPGARFGSEEDDVLDVVGAVLGSGRLSRLHRRLVLERGLANTLSTNNDSRIEAGVFWIYAEGSDSTSLEDLQAAVEAELEELATTKLPKSELDRVQRLLTASTAYEAETASDLAEQIGEYATDGDWRWVLDWEERIQAVTSEQVRAAAERFLAGRPKVVGTCVGAQPEVAPPKPKRKARKKAGSAIKSARTSKKISKKSKQTAKRAR